MYQALQNGIFGFGAIAGASFGGSIADHIGWRWCFLLQVPVSIVAFVIGFLVVANQPGGFSLDSGLGAVWKRVDFSGSLLLVVAVSVQLVGLSLGGNELPWTSLWVIGSLAGSLVLFALFLLVEARTSAIPVIPLRLLQGRLPIATQAANVCAGVAAYGVSRRYSCTFIATDSSFSTSSCSHSSSKSSYSTQPPRPGHDSRSLHLPRQSAVSSLASSCLAGAD